jgi:hypothetical protein
MAEYILYLSFLECKTTTPLSLYIKAFLESLHSLALISISRNLKDKAKSKILFGLLESHSMREVYDSLLKDRHHCVLPLLNSTLMSLQECKIYSPASYFRGLQGGTK